MPTITVEGEQPFELAEGKKLVLGIEDAGIDILHRCGGKALCTTCRIEVLEGADDLPEPDEDEQEALNDLDEPDRYRLSCQLRPDSDLTVRVVKRSSKEGIPPGPRPAD
jgi:ferredoxin